MDFSPFFAVVITFEERDEKNLANLLNGYIMYPEYTINGIGRADFAIVLLRVCDNKVVLITKCKSANYD